MFPCFLLRSPGWSGRFRVGSPFTSRDDAHQCRRSLSLAPPSVIAVCFGALCSFLSLPLSLSFDTCHPFIPIQASRSSRVVRGACGTDLLLISSRRFHSVRAMHHCRPAVASRLLSPGTKTTTRSPPRKPRVSLPSLVIRFLPVSILPRTSL